MHADNFWTILGNKGDRGWLEQFSQKQLSNQYILFKESTMAWKNILLFATNIHTTSHEKSISTAEILNN